jgi:2-methylisocitrate lyase-like PEP mutase family enzyme
VLIARCENPIRGVPDLDDTIRRLLSYQDAGANCLYAPGLATIDQISAVVAAVDRPINVIAIPGGPSVGEIGAAGGCRVSTGSSLMSAAYGAFRLGALELL